MILATLVLFGAIDPELAARLDGLEAKADRNADLVWDQILAKTILFTPLILLMIWVFRVARRIDRTVDTLIASAGLNASQGRDLNRAAERLQSIADQPSSTTVNVNGSPPWDGVTERRGTNKEATE